MPNSEYLRLKALLDSNPQYKVMLDTISKAEGTWGKDAYSTKFGGSKSDWNKGKDKSVIKGSSAHGKYQFMNDTWKSLTDSLGLSGFSPEEQDVAAMKLLEDAGSLKHIDNGEMDKAIFSAAPVWAALPKDASGKSAMPGQKAKPLATVLNYTKSNDEAFAARNKELENLNAKNNIKKTEAEKENIFKRYNNMMIKINQSSVSDEEKNKQRQEIKNKYYRAGNFEIIQAKNTKQYLEKTKLINELELTAKTINLEDGYGGIKDFDQKKYDEIKKKLVKYNINIPEIKKDKETGLFGGGPLTDLKKVIEDAKKMNVNRYESNQNKYGYTREEFDEEVFKNTPTDTGIAADIENGTVPETAKEKADRLKVEADADKKAAELLAAKNKPFESSDILDKYNAPEEWADPQFQYTPGKAKIPFDALIGLTTGLVGAAAADDVEIQYRDEKISEGMLLYAQDIAKIKNMGLPPEIEGGLKMKLQDAYQTGLENIVRASNGNRNLVLGNQGQLDKARMSGLVEIAAMDVERSDKAMAAFGEVQQYMNDFDSKRDIANNERKYQEDQKKQIAGMQLAQQGMSSFIDAIQNAKENAPGSVNDMKRQYFQFATTGLLPNAKPGEVGSLEYKEAKKLEREIFQGKKQTYADWINTKTTDEKDVINNILKKNPQMDLFVNRNADFEELKNKYDQVSGTDEYKSEYQKSKGISELTTTKVEETKKEIVGEKSAEEKVVEKQHVASKEEPIEFTKKYSVAPTIVTTDKLKPVVLLDQLVRGVNGQETGVNTLQEPGQRMNQALANYEDYQNGEGLRQRKHQEESFNRQQVFQEQLKQHNINN